MSSLLRTLSLYHDRPYQNGGHQFSVNSPSHRALSNAKSSSPLSPFFPGVLSQKSSRKGMSSWKKWFFRCLIFFSLGFLLGMAPFGGYEDVKGRDFSFEENTMAKSAENDEGDVRNLLVVEAKGGEGLVVDKVELRVVAEKEVKERFDFVPRKQLIVVTPTYNRALQAYYLNRLGQVLRLVPPPLLWIVVEMSVASLETADILRKTGVMYRHLVTTKNLTDVKDKSVHQRNTALEHIENHKLDGVVYFADDDSIHSLELFESLREIRRFGTWPVAMLAQTWNKVELEGPVCNGSQVIGWHTNKSKGLRRFHIDMSGFAFNSTILWDPKRWQRPTSDPIRQLDTVKEGFHVWIMSLQHKLSIYVWDPYFVELMGSQNQSRWTKLSFHCVSLQGTTFIEQIVEDESQMEGLPLGCSKILNWHLKLEARELFNPKASLLQKNLDV